MNPRDSDFLVRLTMLGSVALFMQVLAVVAHPDDEVLGVGATLARHADGGDDVHVCILSDGVTSRYEEMSETSRQEIRRRRERAERACGELGTDSVSFHDFPDNQFDDVPLLDIVQAIEAEISEHEPGIIYTHHYGDLNIDHELTCRATVTAARPLADSTVTNVLAFETLSATEWSISEESNAFQPTSFIDVSDHLDRKLEALSVYEDELRESPHPRTKDTIRKNAEVWGAKSGFDAAEPFVTLRYSRPYE